MQLQDRTVFCLVFLAGKYRCQTQRQQSRDDSFVSNFRTEVIVREEDGGGNGLLLQFTKRKGFYYWNMVVFLLPLLNGQLFTRLAATTRCSDVFSNVNSLISQTVSINMLIYSLLQNHISLHVAPVHFYTQIRMLHIECVGSTHSVSLKLISSPPPPQ